MLDEWYPNEYGTHLRKKAEVVDRNQIEMEVEQENKSENKIDVEDP